MLVVLAAAGRSRGRSGRFRGRGGVSSEGNSGETENSGQQKSDVFHSNIISLGISLVFSASDISAGKTEGFLERPLPLSENQDRFQVRIVANLHLPKPGKFEEVSIFLDQGGFERQQSGR